jgi:hypothetical protein
VSVIRNGVARDGRHPPIVRTKRPQKSALLDKQFLILCRSAIERTWEMQQLSTLPSKTYGPECIYAATQVQRLFRGYCTRCRLALPDGPLFQHAARLIQFALRRMVIAHRVHIRWLNKRHSCATCIQAWYRGVRVRAQLQLEQARLLIQRVTLLQFHYRSYQFWNLVIASLARRRNRAATQMQRGCRGFLARRRVRRIRHERTQFARALRELGDLHRYQSRCDGCRPDQCSEESLFACFMVRFVGLHDYPGSKALGLEGVRLFPTSARFSFMLSVLLQAMGEDLDLSMAFLRRARLVLLLNIADVVEVRFIH